MRFISSLILSTLLTFSVAGCSQNQADTSVAKKKQPAAATALNSDAEKLSYAFGVDIGKSIGEIPTEISNDLFVQGIKDILDSKTTLLTIEEATEVRMAFITKLQEEQTQEFVALAVENLEKGAAFLANNKTKEGVVSTESGLQYKILTEGDGLIPSESDQVTVHYQGTLIDGTEFDSSYQRGEPITMAISGFIPGWIEALQMMKQGSKYRLFIPADQAYGERGVGPLIQPNSTLIFEVELLEVLKSEAQ